MIDKIQWENTFVRCELPKDGDKAQEATSIDICCMFSCQVARNSYCNGTATAGTTELVSRNQGDSASSEEGDDTE